MNPIINSILYYTTCHFIENDEIFSKYYWIIYYLNYDHFIAESLMFQKPNFTDCHTLYPSSSKIGTR